MEEGDGRTIMELFNGTTSDVGNKLFIGQPLQVYYDYQKVGIWQLGEETQAAAFGQIRVARNSDQECA